MKKIFTLMVALAATSLIAHAVPAKRGYRTYTQPDGTTVSLQAMGDEFSHYYLTTDGIPVLQNADGQFCYASAQNGVAVASAYKAEDPAKRSGAAKSFASSVSLTDFDAAMQSRLSNRLQTKLQARKANQQINGATRATLPQSGLGLYTCNYPRKGKIRSLVFLVEYTDVKFTVSNPKDYYTRMLNSQGFSDNGGTGSARDYFLDQSNGLFDPTFDVLGPVTLKNNRAYYGANDKNGDDQHPEEMALEAAAAFKGQIDYSQYDYDGDGCIDNVYVIYAGVGEASSDVTTSVWPHSWEVEDGPVYNGKQLYTYTCSNEWEDGKPDGIGTFVHEFSHVLGLPDLYHTTSSSAYYTPCEWSVMDYGPYNNDGRTPPCYGAFERNALQWMDPILLDAPASVTLEAIDKSNQAYLIQTEKDNEFFLLENRQLNGWDKYLPYHGMLIWHIDFNQAKWDSNVVNNTKSHQYVDIVEANNKTDGSSLSNLKGYPFPGTSNKTSFTSTTTPALKSWAGKAIDMPITEITETNGVIYFNAAGGQQSAFDGYKPEISKAIYNSEAETIDFEWNAFDEEPVEYTLTLQERIGEGSEIANVTVDFGSSTPLVFPEGWTTSSSSTKANYYTSTGYYGASSPSFRFTADGDELISALYENSIEKVAFWMRGASVTGASALAVYGRASESDAWTQIYNIAAVGDYNNSGTTFEFTPEADVKQIRFVYTKVAGNCALDDIVISFPSVKYVAHSTHEGLTSNTHSVAFPARDAVIRATLFATHKESGKASRVSAPVLIQTSATGVEILSGDATAEWYNLQGLPIAEPSAAGIYILRRGNATRKVLVK